jgi:hypothetical protein
LDVHKKTIDYCVNDGGGRIYIWFDTRHTIDSGPVDENTSQPSTAVREATIFTLGSTITSSRMAHEPPWHRRLSTSHHF